MFTDLAPSTRYRAGDRDDPEARAEHAHQSRQWRRSISNVVFDNVTRELVVQALLLTGRLDDAAERVGVTVAMIYGRMRWDNDFAERVETALAQICRGNPHCGTVRGYRDHRGRCRACRDAKAADRG